MSLLLLADSASVDPFIIGRLTSLTDYHGGSNPVPVILALIGIFALVASGVVYLVVRMMKKARFRNMVEDGKFTVQERALILSYVERLSVYDPITLFEQQPAFDEFTDSISHIHDASLTHFRSIQDEARLFGAIRKKLKFDYRFEEKKRVVSSRALPVGQHVFVVIRNPSEAKRLAYSYNAKVIENEEFYLAISPPEEFKIEDIKSGIHKLEADVSFSRRRDGQYFFLTTVLRIVYEPEHIVILAHRQKLTRTPLIKPLNLPAKIMCTVVDEDGLQQVNEYEIALGAISSTQATFLGTGLPIELHKRDVVVVSFEIENKGLSCRGLISEVLQIKDKVIYQINFAGLDEETAQVLIHFQVHQRASLLAKQNMDEVVK